MRPVSSCLIFIFFHAEIRSYFHYVVRPIVVSNMRSKTIPNLTKKRHFSSGVLFIATMGPISTPKVVEKGTILRPFAPPIDPKEPLWRSKGAQRSHCEGLGRLKWSPKAHFDGFGVPRCPKKLHFYYTDA